MCVPEHARTCKRTRKEDKAVGRESKHVRILRMTLQRRCMQAACTVSDQFAWLIAI